MKFLVLLFLVGCATANFHQGQEEEERNLAEYWEKIKQYFNDLEIEIKKKYMNFGEWVTNTFKEGLDKGASAVENIKVIAEQFIDNAENVGVDVAHEAKEFFSKHKKDLGPLWHKVKDVAGKILRSRRRG